MYKGPRSSPVNLWPHLKCSLISAQRQDCKFRFDTVVTSSYRIVSQNHIIHQFIIHALTCKLWIYHGPGFFVIDLGKKEIPSKFELTFFNSHGFRQDWMGNSLWRILLWTSQTCFWNFMHCHFIFLHCVLKITFITVIKLSFLFRRKPSEI